MSRRFLLVFCLLAIILQVSTEVLKQASKAHESKLQQLNALQAKAQEAHEAELKARIPELKGQALKLAGALNKDGLQNPAIEQLGSEYFQGEEDAFGALELLQQALKDSPFKADENMEVFSISDSRTGEKLVMESILGGCEGTYVMFTYRELNPNKEESALLKGMCSKYKGICELEPGKLVPLETELYQSKSGQLLGKYIYCPKKSEAIEGSLRQVGTLSGKELTMKFDDEKGDGFVKLKFSPDSKEFAGVWSDSQEFTDTFKFTGARAN